MRLIGFGYRHLFPLDAFAEEAFAYSALKWNPPLRFQALGGLDSAYRAMMRAIQCG